ncbi:hypothetical protein CSUB01_11602 [Colletotrichum sublineola]|uniref:Rhodopsin domain-containing protein n=1 Tax=Colletotrichum sublineola TaxID=1173701 RepID=A0A066XLP1_COLSU|nr:hypothetical protein CSUB01_11602 [Colletotrichum sublineola]
MRFVLINAARGVYVVHIRPQHNRHSREPDRILLHVDGMLTNTYPSDVFNYSAPWRQCVDKSQERAMVLAQSVICVLVDCMLVALPLWAVKSHLKMDVKAIQILVVFSLGIFAVASGATRFIIILTTNFTENTHASFLMGPQDQLESTNQSGKRDTIISMDQPNSKSRGQRSENQLKESLTEEGVEMTDLEKGKDRGRTLKQRDIMVDANPSHMANAGKKAKASS